MNLNIVSGNKGGIGKSFVSTLLVDYLQRHEKNFFAIDSETSDIQATFAKNVYNNIPRDRLKTLSITTDVDAEKLVNSLEKNKDNEGVYVMDTGASTLNHLIDNLEFISEIQDDLGVKISVTFMMGPYVDSAVAATAFLSKVRALRKKIGFNFLLLSATGVQSNDFVFMQTEKNIERIKELRGEIYYLNTVRQDWFDLIMKDHVLFGKYLQDKDVPYATRKRLDMWLKGTFDPIAQKLLGV